MIKDSLVYVAVLVVLVTIHFGLSQFIELVYFGKEVILGYFVLLILGVIGNSVFLIEKRAKNIEFPQAFMIVTVFQLLGAMSFVTYLRYTLENQMKTVLLQFVALFIVFLIFQSVYLIITKAQQR